MRATIMEAGSGNSEIMRVCDYMPFKRSRHVALMNCCCVSITNSKPILTYREINVWEWGVGGGG